MGHASTAYPELSMVWTPLPRRYVRGTAVVPTRRTVPSDAMAPSPFPLGVCLLLLVGHARYGLLMHLKHYHFRLAIG
jgi:hypothetical protein